MNIKLNIFIAYSREDDLLRNRLEKHLSSLKRGELISTWYDGKIEAGAEWKTAIDNALNIADIILLLISADFIASDYCYELEMKKAIDRHSKGEANVIPILLHDCDWENTPLGVLQALPKNGKPISDNYWETPEKCLSHIAKSIKSIVESKAADKQKELSSTNLKIKQAEEKLINLETRCHTIKKEIEALEKENTRLLNEHADISKAINEKALRKLAEKHNNIVFQDLNKPSIEIYKDRFTIFKRPMSQENQNMKNDLCPCGSGKEYNECHGK